MDLFNSGFKDTSAVSNLSLLSRDALRSFPTVGTILGLSLSNHLLYGVKPGDWVKLYQLLCVVDKGSWVASVTDSTTVTLAHDDHLVEKIMRLVTSFSLSLTCVPFCLPPIIYGCYVDTKLGFMIRESHQCLGTFRFGVFHLLWDLQVTLLLKNNNHRKITCFGSDKD